MISLRIEGGTETYLSPPHIQDLALDGCRLPTTGKCAGSPLLGRSTRVDWSGCAVTFFPPALALARVADVLASVASWDASFSIVSRNLSVKRSSVASFPGEKASGIDKMKSKAGSTNATTARLLYWVMWWTAFPHCCKTDYIESLACASAPPPSSREHTLVYRFKSGAGFFFVVIIYGTLGTTRTFIFPLSLSIQKIPILLIKPVFMKKLVTWRDVKRRGRKIKWRWWIESRWRSPLMVISNRLSLSTCVI